MARLDLAKIATTRVRIRTILLASSLATCVGLPPLRFFQWAAPLLEGWAAQRTAVAPPTYT